MDVVHSAEVLEQGARFVDDHGVDVEPVPVTDGRCEIVGGVSGHGDDRHHSDCCGKQTKYPRHLSAGFGVSDHAHGKLSVLDRLPRWRKTTKSLRRNELAVDVTA